MRLANVAKGIMRDAICHDVNGRSQRYDALTQRSSHATTLASCRCKRRQQQRNALAMPRHSHAAWEALPGVLPSTQSRNRPLRACRRLSHIRHR